MIQHPLPPFSHSSALKKALRLLQANKRLYIPTCLILLTQLILVGGTRLYPHLNPSGMSAESLSMLVACAGLVASLISNYFSLVLILQVLRLTERAQEEGHEQANPYKVALRKFIPLLLLSLMLLLGIGMGIVLFIIPGIYLLLRLMFTQYTFLEQGGIVRSFKESWRLTEGHFYTQEVVLLVAFGLILLGAITFGLGLIFIQPLVTLYLVIYYRYLQGTAIEQIDEPIA